MTQNRKSGIVIPHKARWYQRLTAVLIVFLVRAVSLTIRFRMDDRAGYFRGSPPATKFIIAFWHNRLALCGVVYRRYLRKFEPGHPVAALVSASRDGGLLAQILKAFKIETVRGSSSRRGAQALVELTSRAENGYDLGITPDGPRGPRYEVHDGVIAAAQFTGLPIVPTSYYLNWKIRLRSWDGFQVPLPFARCDIIAAEPLIVPREISEEQRETLRKQLQQTLHDITRD
jgi:lysophospholipid acyltransferase (LPLAT)-like uncharacterized protein